MSPSPNSKPISISITIFLILLPFSMNASPSSPHSQASLCNSTPHPNFCKSFLPNQTSDIYDFALFAVRRSLSESRKLVDTIDNYLSKKNNDLPEPAARALHDCRFLAGLNIEFLLTSCDTVNGTNQTLPAQPAEEVHTLLSAVLTNQETCLDGLQQAGALENDLSVPLSNGSMLYSVSLTLFKEGWVPDEKKNATWQPVYNRPTFRNGHLNLKMSAKNRKIYNSVNGQHHRRRLLQTDVDEVLVSDIVVVSQDGTENFTTINDAVNVAPNNTNGVNGYFLIYVTAGVYEEYVNIPKNKKYLLMIGDGINQTIITGNRSVGDGSTTFNSGTFIVVSPNFVGVNMTIRNTAGPTKGQAVALRNGGDLSTFYSCSFEGYQDTLYTHSLRQFYGDCDVYGTVDFIFGNAAVVLQNCNIYPRKPRTGQFNAITAQGRTDPNQNTGTSVHNCVVRAADDLVASNTTVQTYLGRPWKEYSRTVFMQSFIDSLINPAGWHAWDGDFALSTLYYAEYNNSGPGSNTTARVTWPGFHVINETDAANFTVGNFLTGDQWLPPTGVPYTSGLIS